MVTSAINYQYFPIIQCPTEIVTSIRTSGNRKKHGCFQWQVICISNTLFFLLGWYF